MGNVKYLIFLFLLFSKSLDAQENKWGIYAGSSIGGPMPVVMADSAYARLHHGVNAGGQYLVYTHGALALTAELAFQHVDLSYGQDLRKDTTVQIQIPMQNGNTLTTHINTYYKADVNGRMKLNFFRAGGMARWKQKKFIFSGGPMLSYFSGGYDKGLVHVTIGEGGVTGLDDYEETYSNAGGINRFALEFILRTEYSLPAGLSLGMQVSRGLTTFYKRDFDIRGERIKFYTTLLGIQLHYGF